MILWGSAPDLAELELVKRSQNSKKEPSDILWVGRRLAEPMLKRF